MAGLTPAASFDLSSLPCLQTSGVYRLAQNITQRSTTADDVSRINKATGGIHESKIPYWSTEYRVAPHTVYEDVLLYLDGKRLIWVLVTGHGRMAVPEEGVIKDTNPLGLIDHLLFLSLFPRFGSLLPVLDRNRILSTMRLSTTLFLAGAAKAQFGGFGSISHLRFGCEQLTIERLDPYAFSQPDSKKKTKTGELTILHDRLVNPGQAPTPHMHQIIGGNAFNASMPSTDISELATCTTCGPADDFSNYWTANLYFKARNGTYKRIPQRPNRYVYRLQAP